MLMDPVVGRIQDKNEGYSQVLILMCGLSSCACASILGVWVQATFPNLARESTRSPYYLGLFFILAMSLVGLTLSCLIFGFQVA